MIPGKLYQSFINYMMSFLLLVVTVAANAETTFTGNMVQGGLLVGHTMVGAKVSYNKKRLTVSDAGYFVVGLGRDSKDDVKLSVVLPDGTTEKFLIPVIERKYNVQRIDGLPPKKVTPDKSVLKRIRQEGAKVRKVRQRDDRRDDFVAGFIWPVEGRISGVYGSQRVLNGKPKRPHFGVDVARPKGTEIVATADGIVTLAEKDLYYSGGTVLIDHGHGLTSSYLHMSKLSVKTGQIVKQGDKIGEIGATGRATGPHLHWGMNWFNTRIDPQLLAGPMKHFN